MIRGCHLSPGQVLPVLAGSGLLELRQCEGGGGGLHCPRGLHHTQVLHTTRAFKAVLMQQLPIVNHVVCVNLCRIMCNSIPLLRFCHRAASHRRCQDSQTGHPAPLYQLARLRSSFLPHRHAQVPQKGQAGQPALRRARRGPLQVGEGHRLNIPIFNGPICLYGVKRPLADKP